ncbi:MULTISPECIES: RNA polymerase sigma-70 factor [unclassified Sphingobacterium]|uniref:RNA polymerase sigma-70 factor n=1 Tax=unclassified Sphingobacterium TaxID=2609468 RepID=UPI0025CCDADF|nr:MULTISPECIES: RNA polymerase sigma-70 factor [unclassified Sphingobacterium]
MADSQLIDFRQKEEAFVMRKLHDRQWQKLLHFCYNIVGEEAEAQDIVQDSFLAIWKIRERWETIENLDNYLFMICRNNALALLKKQTEIRRLAEDIAIHLQNQIQHNALEHIYASETNQHIQGQIQTFPAKMKEVFLLSREEELSQKEIAAKLDISENTVKKQINNVLKVLKKKL